MKERAKRFQRLEFFSLLKVFKKPNVELKRFERLEVDGHKIKIKITKEIEKGFVICPKCQRNNPKESLYCLYCSYIFEHIAKEEKGIELQPWEIRCLGCGRIGARAQKYCLYCGWRIAPFEPEEIGVTTDVLREKENLLSQGEIITLTIDGKTYRSTDKIIPLNVKELMLKIKEEGYSKEMVDDWIKKKNIEIEERQSQRYQNLQERIENLWFDIRWRAVLIIGAIFLIFSLRSCLFRL